MPAVLVLNAKVEGIRSQMQKIKLRLLNSPIYHSPARYLLGMVKYTKLPLTR